MDKVIWTRVCGCEGKAITTAPFGRVSSDMNERADCSTFRGMAATEGGNMTMERDDLPIRHDDHVVDNCAVAGTE